MVMKDDLRVLEGRWRQTEFEKTADFETSPYADLTAFIALISFFEQVLRLSQRHSALPHTVNGDISWLKIRSGGFGCTPKRRTGQTKGLGAQSEIFDPK